MSSRFTTKMSFSATTIAAALAALTLLACGSAGPGEDAASIAPRPVLEPTPTEPSPTAPSPTAPHDPSAPPAVSGETPQPAGSDPDTAPPPPPPGGCGTA